MALDTSIALNANAPQPTNPLQTALQVAQFRAYNANGQAAQQGLDANRAISRAYQQATDPKTGQVDNNKLMAIISQDPAAGFKLGDVVQGINTQKQQQQTLARGDIGLSNDQLDSAQKHLGWAYQTAGSIANNPNATASDVTAAVGRAIDSGQITPQIAAQALADMPGADAPKGALQQWAANHVAQAAGQAQQLGIMLPKTGAIDKGDQILLTNTNPVSGDVAQTGSINKALDPATATAPVPVYQNGVPGIAPRNSLPGFGGAGSPPPLPSVAMPTNMPTSNGQAAPLPSGPAPGAPAGFVATGPAMGVQGSNDGNVDVVNKHWTAVGNDAQNAQTNIGIAQNIKAYADKALTGKQGDKLAAVNGILSIFGQGGQTDISTATDLLQKNMARLSLTSRQGAGGTDAAGALATAANPHGTMTAEAIKDAADQVIGSQKMALAQQQLLQPFKLNNDVAGYQSTLSKFNQAADPRVWQFQGMTPEQRASFKASMSPADQKAFSSKIRTLEGMGAIQ
jgi:hypothetical protein